MNNEAINEFGFRRIWRIKQISGFKTPTSRRQPVDFLQARPRIWTRDDQEQIQTLDRQIASLTHSPLSHAASSAPRRACSQAYPYGIMLLVHVYMYPWKETKWPTFSTIGSFIL